MIDGVVLKHWGFEEIETNDTYRLFRLKAAGKYFYMKETRNTSFVDGARVWEFSTHNSVNPHEVLDVDDMLRFAFEEGYEAGKEEVTKEIKEILRI